MPRLPLVRRVLRSLFVVAVPLTLLVVFLEIQEEFAQNRALRQAVDRSVTNQTELVAALSDMQDVEVGQRGYVITGNRDFLDPYEKALVRLRRRFSDTSQSWSVVRTDRLRRLANEKIAFAAETVDLVSRGRNEEARSLVMGGEGKRLMDAFRAEVDRLNRQEGVRLANLTRARDRNREDAERTINVALAGLAFLLVVLTIAVARTLAARRTALAKVGELSARNRAILNGAVDGMLVLDERGYILETNPSVTRLFGYSADELVTMHNVDLMAKKPPLEESMAWLQTVGAAGASGSGAQEEWIGRRKDGTTLATDVSISRFDGGETPSYVAIIRDITDRKRIEQMKTEFVSTVSHELRTPLTSIGGSLGLLAAGAVGPLGDKAARLVKIAHSNCERLIRLINDILDIEKIESGKMVFDLRRMPLGPLVQRTAIANRAFGADRKIDIAFEMPPWPISVMGDPDRLEQLLTNLVSNAVKHSPEGGTVEVALTSTGGRAVVEVRDRGSGVPADFRDRMFGKFAMADGSDSRARGGTGLGLAIAREIGERHGGTVQFRDRVGGGSVFWFDLPMADCEDANAAGTQADAGLPILLHIDDDRDCLSVVASAFAGRAAVQSVSSMAEARSAVANGTFAGAIVDVVVPPDNGLDLVPALRKIAPGLPIVVFSALDEVPATTEVDAVMVKSRTSFDTLVETTMALVSRASREAA